MMMEKFDLNKYKKDKNYVIEASAGTGKTYNIVEIVKKLVGVHGAALDQILIVTYTEKAAGELKDRIRKELKSCDVDNAPIFTIHSFCQNTIKEFGISAKLPLSLNVIDDNALKDFAHRYIRRKDVLDEIGIYISSIDFKANDLANCLYDALKKYYLDSEYKETSVVKAKDIREDLALFTCFKKAKNLDDLFRLLNDKKCGSDIIDAYGNFIKSSEKEAKNFVDALKFDGNFVISGCKKNTHWSDDDDIRKKLSEDFITIRNCRDKIAKIEKSLIYKILAIKQLKDFYQKWQEEKALNRSQTYDDMIRTVRESVIANNSPLLKALQKKYRYAIIDEFQDTNQLQFDIFSKIFLCKDHHIIVVGDPKQSIYAFQGADVAVYHKAKKEIEAGGGEICCLDKNFRSTKYMVESCNNLFKYYGDGFDNAACKYLDDSKKHMAELNGQEVTKAFWIAGVDNGVTPEEFAKIAVEQILECCKINDNGETNLRINAKLVCDSNCKIDKKDCKGKNNCDDTKREFRNVTFSDFAVLARTRSEMPAIESALKKAGIPFIRYKDKRLYSEKECADWLALLKAINLPDFTERNRRTLKKALFTNFFGLSIKEIADKKYDVDSCDEFILIKKWREIAADKKWEALFSEIISNSKITERMNTLGEIQSLSTYKQISDACIEYLSNGHTIEELIKYLTELSENNSSADDDENGILVKKPTNFNCVKIMTIHASKGLQFPVVIAVAGFIKPGNNMSKFDIYHNGDERILSFNLSDSENEILAKEQIAEYKRLFYVAYTRAQYILMLPKYKNIIKKLEFLNDTLSEYIKNHNNDFKRISDSDSGNPLLPLAAKDILSKSKLSKPSDEVDESSQKENIKRVIKNSNEKATYKHSYASLSHVDSSIDDDNVKSGLSNYDDKNVVTDKLNYNENKTPIKLSPSYPKGTHAGDALHKIFEHLNFEKIDNYITNNKALKEIIDREFKNQGLTLSDEDIKNTIKMIVNVLNAKLPKIKGNSINSSVCFNLTEIKNENKKHEIEFNFKADDSTLKNICNGFIDLLFKREKDDCYCLLDWKSDSISERLTSYTDKDALKKHVDNQYSIQRVLYSYCLIKWLKSFYKKSEEEIFNNHFGGIYYVFLRGCNSDTSNGIYAQTWQSWNDLENAFKNICNDYMRGK